MTLLGQRLKIKDPVFAVYLMHIGHDLLDIIPSAKNVPKEYVFNLAEVGKLPEYQFLGIGGMKKTVSWRTFISLIDRLLSIEDVKLRQISNRVNKTGLEVRGDRVKFVTSSQAVAAFLLSDNKDGEVYIETVQMLGRDKGFLFVFDSTKKDAAHIDRSYQQMMTFEGIATSWWEVKCAYKHATSIRRAILRIYTEEQ